MTPQRTRTLPSLLALKPAVLSFLRTKCEAAGCFGIQIGKQTRSLNLLEVAAQLALAGCFLVWNCVRQVVDLTFCRRASISSAVLSQFYRCAHHLTRVQVEVLTAFAVIPTSLWMSSSEEQNIAMQTRWSGSKRVRTPFSGRADFTSDNAWLINDEGSSKLISSSDTCAHSQLSMEFLVEQNGSRTGSESSI
mmetsp:Transcript_11695/g.21184  ORF Transcript_11695/g.21184 Transcript_11695/m.21184 type:complete len:192 (-) Transcript_11695:419-994(-)